MVHIQQQVVDGVGHVEDAAICNGLLPIWPPNEQREVRRDAHEEGDRHGETHERRLPEVTLGVRHDDVHALSVVVADENANDDGVADENDNERRHADHAEGDPRTHERLEVLVAGHAGAVRDERARVGVDDGAPRPEHVRVLGARARQHARAQPQHVARARRAEAAQRKPDCGCAIGGEDGQQPYGRVAARERAEVLQLTGERTQLVQDNDAGLFEPLRQQPQQQDAIVSRRHARQVHVSRRPAESHAAEDDERQRVAENPHAEDQRGSP